jgi:hypothetical protein
MKATMIRMRVALTIFVAVLTIEVQPSAQSQTYTTIDVPGSTGTTAVGINQAGVITGNYTDANFVSHGFLRAVDGTITSFDPPASTGTTPGAINPTGVITGTYTTGDYADENLVNHAFLRTVDGKITTIDAPGAGAGFIQGTSAGAINPAGEITGWYTDENSVSHGYRRTVTGAFTSFDVPGSGGIQPIGINPAGVITGNYFFPAGEFFGFEFYVPHGFVRDAKGSITLIAPSTWFDIEPQAVNPAGIVAGKYQDGPTGLWGFFLRAKDGTITQIDNLPGLNTAISVAINQEGAMTGWYIDTNPALVSFVRTADGQVSVIADPNAGTGIFQGTQANCINAAGQIAGSYSDPNYVSHGFLRIP